MKSLDILNHISEVGEISEAELFTNGETSTAISQQVYRLTKKGLIERNANGNLVISSKLDEKHRNYMESIMDLDKNGLLKEIDRVIWYRFFMELLPTGAVKKIKKYSEAIL